MQSGGANILVSKIILSLQPKFLVYDHYLLIKIEVLKRTIERLAKDLESYKQELPMESVLHFDNCSEQKVHQYYWIALNFL